MSDDLAGLEIKGGAGPHEAAAIAAAVTAALEAERAADATPPGRSALSSWVASARRPVITSPSHPTTPPTRAARES